MKSAIKHLLELIETKPPRPEPHFLMTASEFEFFNKRHMELSGTPFELDPSRSFHFGGAKYTVAP